MSSAKIALCIFYFFIYTVLSFGQRAPVKYGKVDEKETALTSYQSADAVILCDYGEYKFNGITGEVYFQFIHHLRIKILTEAGIRYATQQIRYYDLFNASYHPYNLDYTLRAQTLNVNAKGKVIASKVKFKNTDKTKPDENFNASLNIHFPDVKPGSIIEYEFTLPTIETVNPDPWMVQYDIPSLWSELRIITPLEFNYAVKPYNMDYADVWETKGLATSISFPGRTVVYNGNQFRFIRKDIPALLFPGIDIDYNNSRMFVKFMLDNASKNFLFPGMTEIFKAVEPEYKYLSKAEKQISITNAGYVLYKRPDLAKIAKDLNKSERFGKPMIIYMGLNDTIRKLTGMYDTDEEKVMAIYNFVASQVGWNNQYRIFVDAGVPLFFVKLVNKFANAPVNMNTSLTKIMSKQEGTNSEINSILINLLKSAGFKANPVLVSTLNNGYLDTAFFNLHQFNHLIAYVELDGREILLDAVLKGDRSVMNSDIMNEYGLMIELKNARWIKVAYPYALLPRNFGVPGFKQTE